MWVIEGKEKERIVWMWMEGSDRELRMLRQMHIPFTSSRRKDSVILDQSFQIRALNVISRRNCNGISSVLNPSTMLDYSKLPIRCQH